MLAVTLIQISLSFLEEVMSCEALEVQDNRYENETIIS